MLNQSHACTASSQFVSITMKNGVLRAAIVCPSINERASQIISCEINEAMARAGKRLKALVLDMAQVTQMSSIGLGMCINARNAAHAAGAPTFTVSLGRELADLFRMMRVDRLLTMTLNEAELANVLG